MAQVAGSEYKVSVCLASYNGEKFIHEQIESILSDLGQSDELIICDDGSTDRTCSIIQSFNDARITLIHNKKNLGYARNFEKLISLTTGDYIFLADQDNIWLKGKVQKVLSVFEEDNSIRLVCHNLQPVDTSGNDFKMNIPLCRGGKRNSFILLVRHFIKAQLYGCTFCLNRRGVNDLLPFPSSAYAHDHWIIVWAAVNGHIFFLEEALIKYRRHDANISRLKRFPFATILLLRYKLLLQICTAAYRRLQCSP
jgi:glycosyltransferase involved in cell wall biosynthesis